MRTVLVVMKVIAVVGVLGITMLLAGMMVGLALSVGCMGGRLLVF